MSAQTDVVSSFVRNGSVDIGSRAPKLTASSAHQFSGKINPGRSPTQPPDLVGYHGGWAEERAGTAQSHSRIALGRG